MHRIVAAARDLANETGSASFTIAQLAERAGLSFKSVYRHFAGKDEILIALLEEDSRTGAELLAEELDRCGEEPLARIEGFVMAIFELLTHREADGYAGVLLREQRRLHEEHPKGLEAALAPLVDLLATDIERAVAAHAIEPVDPERAARTVFGLILSGIAEVTLAGADPLEQATWVWRFCSAGIGVRPDTSAAPDTPKPRRRSSR